MHTLQGILRPTWQKAGCISGRSLTVGSKSREVPGKAVVLELDYAATWDHLGDHWHGRRLLALHLMSSWLLDRMLYSHSVVSIFSILFINITQILLYHPLPSRHDGETEVDDVPSHLPCS